MFQPWQPGWSAKEFSLCQKSNFVQTQLLSESLGLFVKMNHTN